MKNIILALFVFLGVSMLAPQAEAGHRYRSVRYYDHCDRPSYGYHYREHYRYRPVVYRSVRYRSYDPYCYDRPVYYRRYSSRPRVSFHIGF